MSKTKLIGEVDQVQIDAWKKKYGQVYAVKSESHISYLRQPDRKILGFASVAGKSDPVKFNETLINNCFIGGSDIIKTDDEHFFGASAVIAQIIKSKESELVNL